VIETEALKKIGESFTYKGLTIPRLTAIMDDLGITGYKGIPAADREFYLRRGQLVHRACDLDDLGQLREETLDPVLVPYLTGWRRAVNDLRLTFSEIESRKVNEVYWYTTGPDRIGAADGIPAVIEIKTGTSPWWVGMQLAAQAACLPDGHLLKRISIALPGDGSYVPTFPTDRNDRALILGGIALYNRKQKQ
jgi:hypothetical protein